MRCKKLFLSILIVFIINSNEFTINETCDFVSTSPSTHKTTPEYTDQETFYDLIDAIILEIAKYDDKDLRMEVFFILVQLTIIHANNNA